MFLYKSNFLFEPFKVPAYCLLVAIILVANNAKAGAWVQEPGEFEVISTVSYSVASRGYDDLASLSENIEFSKLETSIYVEYGLLKNWSIVGRIAYQDISLQRGAGIDAGSGLSASNISLKYNITQLHGWVLSTQAGILIPGSTENGLDLRLGEGSLEWEARALLGKSFKALGRDGFIDIQLARQFRAAFTPNEWKVDLTAGYYPKENLMVLGQVFATIGDKTTVLNRRTLRSVKMQGSLVWFLQKNNGVQLSISRPISGRNVIADTTIGISWWLRY